MIVYHGSCEIVEKPDVMHSFRPLDFGKGFYVTTIKEQAERWAKRKADLFGKSQAVMSIYQMQEDYSSLTVKTFNDDLIEWIDFVCACRDGGTEYQVYPSYDQIAFISQNAINQLLRFQSYEVI